MPESPCTSPQLRKELDDQLFSSHVCRTRIHCRAGCAWPSRAVEILGLQQQTAIEVTEAAHGRRLLRIAASSSFAEHAAPGLIELFSSRARDLSVELSVHPRGTLPRPDHNRAPSTSRWGPFAARQTTTRSLSGRS